MFSPKEKNINLYSKLLGFLIKKGKKTKTKAHLGFSFFKVCFYYKKSIGVLLNGLFLELNTFVETKTLNIRQTRYIVPFPINLRRRIHLILRWFVSAILLNTTNKPFHTKFIEELLLLLNKKRSKVSYLKNLNIVKASVNRSNTHYRW